MWPRWPLPGSNRRDGGLEKLAARTFKKITLKLGRNPRISCLPIPRWIMRKWGHLGHFDCESTDYVSASGGAKNHPFLRAARLCQRPHLMGPRTPGVSDLLTRLNPCLRDGPLIFRTEVPHAQRQRRRGLLARYFTWMSGETRLLGLSLQVRVVGMRLRLSSPFI